MENFFWAYLYFLIFLKFSFLQIFSEFLKISGNFISFMELSKIFHNFIFFIFSIYKKFLSCSIFNVFI